MFFFQRYTWRFNKLAVQLYAGYIFCFYYGTVRKHYHFDNYYRLTLRPYFSLASATQITRPEASYAPTTNTFYDSQGSLYTKYREAIFQSFR